MPIDENKLIVSWNRYEQGLMKAHLMKCIKDDDYCFGNENEVVDLHYMLAKHGVLQPGDYNHPNFQQLVGDIKGVIQQKLSTTPSKGNSWINNDEETAFLTRFAMAIQDTKIRGQFYPENVNSLDDANQNISPNLISAYGITIAKARLLSLATQLTRIGLNCQTTVINSNNLRNAAQNASIQRTINFIDTNNFLYEGSLNMKNIGIGMEPFKYYFNLYRKLFDLALKREWDQMQNNQPKIPRFLIPLTGYWDKSHKIVNPAIKQALESLFNINYNATQKYGNLIAVDIVDYNNSNSGLFKDWQKHGHGRVLNSNLNTELFNDDQYEDYAIGSGDHYTFIGNECMNCWQIPNTVSHEAFAMKTDFPKFYGQNGQFADNGYCIIDKNQFQMPTDYQLHMNYHNDKIVPINEINKGIKFDTKYGMNNNYPNIQKY